ncbi:MAG TPA: L-threonylcarbamoyladenylate synthase [Actinomycetota bacterium]|nr:L-threonylcarbamoyladenylate synthase [Actinomycetota bacterium]
MNPQTPVDAAASAALAGSPIVFPTDTVYGIGTRADDPEATARLFEAKARPRDLELPVLVPSAESAREIAVFDERADVLALAFWAGPLTIVLPRADASRAWDLGGDPGTIGVRMPHHPLTLALLARTGPLAVSSANRSGEQPPSTCEELRNVFGDAVAIYLCADGPLGQVGSSVVDLTRDEPRMLRTGAVSEDDVREALRRTA